MAVGTPSSNQGANNTPTISVPAGLATGDIVVLVGSQDTTTGTFNAKWPSGFTQLGFGTCTADGQSWGVAYKRQGATPDSGTYTLSALGTSAGWALHAIVLTGRHATDAPVLGTVTTQNTLQASGSTITATGVTAVAGDDLLFISLPDVNTNLGGNGHSSWTAGFTEILDFENSLGGGNDWQNTGIAKAENVSAGATGDKTVTFATSSGTFGWNVMLLRVPAASGGTTPLTGQRRVRYEVLAALTGQRRVRYEVLAALTGQRRLRFEVLAALTGTRRLRYEVLAALTGVRAIRYDVGSTALSGVRAIRYEVLAALSGQRRVAYAVLAPLTGQRRVRYEVLAGVGGVRAIRYEVKAPLTGSRRVRYEVLSAGGPAVTPQRTLTGVGA